MMMTAEEAKRAWCPMARQAGANCSADKCAMWRWVPSKETRTEFRVVPTAPGRYGREYFDVPAKPTHGYCGLAGRPDVA